MILEDLNLVALREGRADRQASEAREVQATAVRCPHSGV